MVIGRETEARRSLKTRRRRKAEEGAHGSGPGRASLSWEPQPDRPGSISRYLQSIGAEDAVGASREVRPLDRAEHRVHGSPDGLSGARRRVPTDGSNRRMPEVDG